MNVKFLEQMFLLNTVHFVRILFAVAFVGGCRCLIEQGLLH